MKGSCLGVLTLICIVLGLCLQAISEQKHMPSYPCPERLPSYLSTGDTAKVVNLQEGHFLPLYSEPYPTGGTNGGLTNGTLVVVKQGPVCNDYGVWWEVTGNGGLGYEITGWAQEVTDKERFLVSSNEK